MYLPKDVFEYLLVGHPSPGMFALIKQEKKLFTERYNQAIAYKTSPHITIANFLSIEGIETTFNRLLQNICRLTTCFPVTLDGYSGFPSHTIYLRVKNQLPFQQLAKQLKPVADIMRSSGCPPFKIINKAHLTIARGLPEDVYAKAMADYSQKTFHESFMLDELILLRLQYQFDACKTIQVFRLRPADSNLLVM